MELSGAEAGNADVRAIETGSCLYRCIGAQENEGLVADDLELNIRKLIDGPLEIVQIRSVKEGIGYFNTNKNTDLISKIGAIIFLNR